MAYCSPIGCPPRLAGCFWPVLGLLLVLNGCSAAKGGPGSPLRDGDAQHFEPTSAPLLGGAISISRNFVPPASIQGVGDFYWYGFEVPGDLNYEMRNAELGRRGAGVAAFSVRWSEIDLVDVVANPPPGGVNCMYVPIGDASYCFNGPLLDRLEMTLRTNAKNGIQTALTIWSPPRSYGYDLCRTSVPISIGGQPEYGCVPRPDARIHFRRLFEYLARRFSSEDVGHLTHFIVLNEVTNSGYFNMLGVPRAGQPGEILDPRTPELSAADIRQWASEYAALMRAAHDGIADSGRTDVMLYASLDGWFRDEYHAEQPVRSWTVNDQYFIDALKNELGVSMDWALSIHPYGDPSIYDVANPNPEHMSFASLAALRQQMINWLRSIGATDPDQYPQSKIFASEQSYWDPGQAVRPTVNASYANYPGEPVSQVGELAYLDAATGSVARTNGGNTRPLAGRVADFVDGGVVIANLDYNELSEWICRAHHEATRVPGIIAVTHNHFQMSPEEQAEELSGLPAGNGNDVYTGLVPASVSGDTEADYRLATLANSPTGRAYIATFGNGGWRRTDDHECCTRFSLGCATPVAPIGHVDSLETTANRFTLHGWACVPKSRAPVDVHVYSGDYGTTDMRFIKAARANTSLNANATAACGAGERAFGFDIPFTRNDFAGNVGRSLHVFAIAPDGGPNPVLAKPYDIRLPEMPSDYNGVTGWVDDLVQNYNLFVLRGWGCAKGQTQPIDLEVVAGPNRQHVKVARTSFVNEADVSMLCGVDANGTYAYRFEIPFTRAEVSGFQGQSLYVKGLSPFGEPPVEFGRQSDIQMPQVPGSYQLPGTVIGWVDELVLVPHRFTLVGWACALGDARSIDVHVYAGTQFIKSARTDAVSDPAIAQLCGTQGALHKFLIPFTADQLRNRAGEVFHVYGITPSGGVNPLLGKRSDIRVPSIPYDY